MPRAGYWQRLSRWWNTTEADINIQAWLAIAAVLLLLSAIIRAPVLGILALVIAVIGLALRIWWDFALRNLTYTRHFSTTRAFWGDTVTMDLTLENAKPLPLPRTELRETVSSQVNIVDHATELSIETQGRVFRTLFSLGMYERVTQHFTLTCDRRGWQRFGPVQFVASDPFGMVSRKESREVTEGVLVYPRMVPVSELVVPARQPIGDFKPSTPLVDDPMRIAGIRPYVPGDSPKRIHWRATARTGDLQSRVYEASATPIAAIFLDTRTFSFLWEGQKSEVLELAIVTAASISRQMLENRYQVGLYANAPIPNVSKAVRIPPGRRPAQMQRILEDLARLVPSIGKYIERMIAEEILRLPWGASIVLITARLNADSQKSLLRLSRSAGARRFVIVTIGEVPELLPEFRRRFVVWNLGAEEAWDAISNIQLSRVS